MPLSSGSQNAVASLGPRPEEEAAAHAWDLNANAVDAQAEQDASQEFGTEATEAAWTRYVQREHLLVLRNQLAAGELVGQYAGAHPKPWARCPPPRPRRRHPRCGGQSHAGPSSVVGQ